MSMRLFIIFFLSFSFQLSAKIKDSIVPLLEAAEQVENLQKEKYSERQLEEITDGLKHLEEKVRIVSFNMLCNDRDAMRPEDTRWPKRLPRIVTILQEIDPDLIAIQELYASQLKELTALLDADFAFFGDRRTDEEYCGIFFRKSRFEVIQAKTYPIPQIGRIGNIVTLVQLKDKKTNETFALFNIHVMIGANEREHEIRFILDKMIPLSQTMPVVLAGDLNLFPHRTEIKIPYYDGDYIHRLLTKNQFHNASEVALLGHYGPISTFTNDPKDGIGTPFLGTGCPGVMLDRFYVSNKVEVLVHAVQPARVDGQFASDHMPIFMDCYFSGL
jgi:endonuclease/exonuclease/phosphatase family metal-dependent hydrolase